MKKYRSLAIAYVAFVSIVVSATEAPDVLDEAPMEVPEVVVVTSDFEVTDGCLEHFELYSPQLQRNIPIDVWLPSAYDADRAEGYPVVYMHDGQNLFDATRTWNRQAWEIDSVGAELIASGAIPVPIVVGVYNNPETRVGDLMPNGMIDLINPELTAEGIAMMCPAGIRGDLYVDFLADTLKPVVDGRYNTLPEAASTSVMGSSMGGLISLGAICERPDVFGRAACLSTHITGFGDNTVFPTAVNAYLIGRLPIDGEHKVYVDTGDCDIDAAYAKYFPAFVQTFIDLGYNEGSNFMRGFYPGHSHCEACWMLRVAEPLKFLLAN